jgi:hypothetical protein
MRVMAVVGLVAGFSVGCGAQPAATTPIESGATAPVETAAAVTVETSSVLSTTVTSVNLASQIRVEIADGCPATVADHPDGSSTAASWITNPDVTDLDQTFVPGIPTGALICRYTALNAPPVALDGRQLESGDLFGSTTLDAAAATALATTLNDIVPSSIASACLFAQQSARFTAIVFAVPGRSDVDLWLKDWIGCPEVGNGTRTSGELINGIGDSFLVQLDADAPRAPAEPPFTPTS